MEIDFPHVCYTITTNSLFIPPSNLSGLSTPFPATLHIDTYTGRLMFVPQ